MWRRLLSPRCRDPCRHRSPSCKWANPWPGTSILKQYCTNEDESHKLGCYEGIVTHASACPRVITSGSDTAFLDSFPAFSAAHVLQGSVAPSLTSIVVRNREKRYPLDSQIERDTDELPNLAEHQTGITTSPLIRR